MPQQVTLTFAGDSAQLEKTTDRVSSAFDKVGDSARKMGGSSSRSFDDTGNSMGKLGDKADGAETSLIGVHDVIDGTATIMQGPGKAGMVAYIQGWADVAGGIAPLLSQLSNLSIAMIKNAATSVASSARVAAGWVVSAATATASALTMAAAWVIGLGPIALVIGGIALLVGAFVALWMKSEAFRNFWKGLWKNIQDIAAKVWNWVKSNWPLLLGILAGPIGIAVALIIKNWDRIKSGAVAAFNVVKSAAGTAVSWVTSKFNALLGFVRGLPGRATAAFRGMFDGIKNAFRSAVNWVIDKWNNFSIPGVNTHIPGIGTVGGFSTPNLPRFHTGGVVPGTPGQEVLSILQAGETVSPRGAGGKVEIDLRISGSGSLAQTFLGLMRKGDINLTANGVRVVPA